MAEEPIPYESKRKQLNILLARLKLERTSFTSTWRELGDYILPYRPRHFVTDANRGNRKTQKIIDATATISARTLRSGMMSGITSPARPWFRLTTPDPKLSEAGAVKQWLSEVTSRMSTVFLKSNVYNVLPLIYGDVGVFATAAMYCEEDPETVTRFYSWPIGSYMISANSKGKIDTTCREFRMTVRQLIEEFGERDEKGKITNWDNFSTLVKDLYRESKTEEWIDVVHFIRPNPNWKPGNPLSKFKRYQSCYYEYGTTSTQTMNYLSEDDEDRYLRESGYDLFPVLCPRWEVTGEDVYGTDCPGITALGDIKSLQTIHKRIAQGIEKGINPPLSAPSILRSTKVSILPGDTNYYDVTAQAQGIRAVHEVSLRVSDAVSYAQEHQQRIQKIFFEDLFLMLSQSDRRQITAREIDERHEEKLLALGPVLEQLNQDLLDPLIDIVFEHMNNQGLIPEPPEELQGSDLKVEYISIMAQAQKLISIGGIERYAGFAAQLAQISPESLDKTDTDQMLDVYSDITSLPPGIVRTDEDVAAIRAQRQQAQQAQQMAELMQQGASTAKDLSQADTSGENALTGLLNQAQAGALTQ